jgi:hypothetical protein
LITLPHGGRVAPTIIVIGQFTNVSV